MYKLIFSFLLAVALFSCDDAANASDIPAEVMSAFNSAYPNATDVEWEMEDDTYEVEFDFNGEEMEVNYDAMGRVVEIDD